MKITENAECACTLSSGPALKNTIWDDVPLREMEASDPPSSSSMQANSTKANTSLVREETLGVAPSTESRKNWPETRHRRRKTSTRRRAKEEPAPEDPNEFPAEAMAALRQNMIDLEAEDEKLEMTDLDSTNVPDAVTKVEEDAEQIPPQSKKAENNITKEDPDLAKTSRFAHLIKYEEDETSDE